MTSRTALNIVVTGLKIGSHVYQMSGNSSASSIEKLIEHVAELTSHLKDAKSDLKNAIEGTELYEKILKATLKQTSTGCDIPDKAAKTHAFKVTLANFEKKKED